MKLCCQLICNEYGDVCEKSVQENLAGKLCGNIGNEGAGNICNEDMQEYEDVLRGLVKKTLLANFAAT